MNVPAPRVLRAAAVLAVVDVVVALIMSSGRPARPSFGTERVAPPVTVAPPPAGVVVVIRRAGGIATPVCFVAATTAAARARNLRGVLTFDIAAGLALIRPTPTTAGVTLAGADLVVTVAYYTGAGAFVSATPTRPCPSGVGCPTYPPAGPYRLALEVPPRTAAGLGLTAGSTAHVGGACGA